ncbi:hypothetical protein FQN57_002438 [Myotisia sp. PD_48]|nr:hypothetical protein FQN57_002438 [Myotisia sp. PD_48]
MESSPLIQAHSHARNALFETRKTNPVAASEEHDLAAGEFAGAAQSTTDPIALRTLRLLEEHHKRLADIIRFQHEHPRSTDLDSNNTTAEPAANSSNPPTPRQGPSASAVASLGSNQHPPRVPSHTPRNTTSIAGNLASARGIPSQQPRATPISPTLSIHNARARMAGSPERTRHHSSVLVDSPPIDGKNQSKRVNGTQQLRTQPNAPEPISPEVVSPNNAKYTIAGLKNLAGDEPFRRFYSTFEGLISKMSAPLAFASLPLGSDPNQQRNVANQKSTKAGARVYPGSAEADITSFSHKEPDVSKLVSSAALRAIKDKDGKFASFNPTESFYVVPTGGGTISYAAILSRADKEARKNSFDDVEDDFVDASEDPPSPETTHNSRELRNKKIGLRSSVLITDNKDLASQNSKTVEELQMENETLKHLSDTLAKRLHMWEVSAQSSSLALQQSLRAIHNHALTSPSASTVQSPAQGVAEISPPPNISANSEARIKELEASIRNSEKENEKLKSVIGRYRERWEKLKEGARVRREGNGNGNGSGATQSPSHAPTTE